MKRKLLKEIISNMDMEVVKNKEWRISFKSSPSQISKIR